MEHNKNLQADKLTKRWNVAAPQSKSLSIAAEIGVLFLKDEFLKKQKTFAFLIIAVLGIFTVLAQLWLSNEEDNCREYCLESGKDYRYIEPHGGFRLSTSTPGKCSCVQK